ncbi:MAG: hypothetical protein AAFP84_13850, partial [Actinomycetota bacterium]
NEEWGAEGDRPADLTIVAGDAELARHYVEHRDRPAAVAGGDLHRTIGARPIGDRTELRALPIDLMRVQIDDGPPITGVSHVVVRSRGRSAGWWRGPVTLVMNAEFLGEWDVAARGHPNDGRVERFDLDAATSVRQRRAIAQRLPGGRHLPHPAIRRRSGAHHTIEAARPMAVRIDGVDRGLGRLVVVTVEPDAATLYA